MFAPIEMPMGQLQQSSPVTLHSQPAPNMTQNPVPMPMEQVPELPTYVGDPMVDKYIHMFIGGQA